MICSKARLVAAVAALALGGATVLAACSDRDDASPEASSVSAAVSCDPFLERYPVAGPHNGGYDLHALDYTCPPHPGQSPDGSDYLAGDHYGNDLFAKKGTPVVVPRSGVVEKAGFAGISGNRVTIRDDCGWHYFHAHLDVIAPNIVVGARVNAGDPVGTVGNTGNASGTSAHLHFSIYPGAYEEGIDPFPYLQTVDATSCAGCTPHCEGSVIVDQGCGKGDCGAFGLTCSMASGQPACVEAPCTPHCEGAVIVGADCGRGDCSAFGATCAMQGGQPTCQLSCTPHCEGAEVVGADCGRGDCSAFGASCVMEGGQPTCKLSCAPHCEGSVMVGADCGRGDCGAFGLTCSAAGGTLACVEPGCTPHCEGAVMVGADCGRGDCGAFGAACVMQGGQPTCQVGCTPHCEGDVAVGADCGRGDCSAFGATCALETQNGALTPTCKVGCTAHCDGSVIVDADCGRGDCAGFGLDCVENELGKPICGTPSCPLHCDGNAVVMSDCSRADCGAFGLTCGDFGVGPECTIAACTPHCEGEVMVDAACARGDCGAFGVWCSTAGGTPPHCVVPACVGSHDGTPTPGDVCIGNQRYRCDSTGAADSAPCPSGQACNRCAGCGPEPTEVCDFADNDCDGQTDEGTRNRCGGCGAEPAEVCNYLDDDCDGQTDEGLRNACGACGALPTEVCNYLDDDCDGETDEGVRNACGRCGEVPVEICDDIDDDCDGQTDEGFAGLGSLCAAGVGACERTGTVRCAADGHATACAAVPGEGRAETCNGIDDDCDGETDEGFGVGEACVVGSGQCAVAGVVACAPGAGSGGGPDGATVCAQTARSCDDGDPCSDDSCDAVRGCTHAAIEGCCAGPGGACGAGESCVEGRCAALLCAPCDPAVGCPAPGSICLDYPGGAACATACAAAGDCPPGFDCTLFTNDGTSETTQVCVAAAETCTCEDTPAERCADDRLVRTGACGVIADVIGTCTRGCVDGVGCCPVGTTKSDGACVPDAAEPEPDRAPESSGAEVAEVSRGHADDGCAGGGAGGSGLLLGGLGVAALALSSRRRSRSSAPRAR